jgi:hypothetical protein
MDKVQKPSSPEYHLAGSAVEIQAPTNIMFIYFSLGKERKKFFILVGRRCRSNERGIQEI